MEFREYASSETSALIARLIASRSATSLDELQTLRSALETAARAAETALSAPPHVDRDIAQLVETLAAAAAADAHSSAQKAADEARKTVDDLQAQLRKSKEEAESVRAQLAELGDAYDQAGEARLKAEVEGMELARAKATMEDELQELRGLLDATLTESARAGKELEGAHRESEAMREEVLEFGLLLEQLVGAFQHLAAADTITGILQALVRQLTARFSRVALFRVKSNRLEGEHQAGFDSTSDITNVAMPLSVDSLLTRAVGSGAIESLTGSELADSSRAPFGGTPSCALALPLVVNGAPIAVVYADDSGQGDTDQAAATLDLRSTFAELLLCHTTALVQRQTNELKALAELREYATTLLKEAEHMYVADAHSGKSGKDLQSRLADNLECARRIYAQRIAPEGPAAAALLEERLAEVIDAQKGTPFGRDLANVSRGAQAQSPRREAEAS